MKEIGEVAARWVIAQVRSYADSIGEGLSELDENFYTRSLLEIPDKEHHFFVASHNRAVELIRGVIETAKENGLPCISVRQGLSLPVVWQDRYEEIYVSELPWMISLAMQNAFLGNPLVGEEEPWHSP